MTSSCGLWIPHTEGHEKYHATTSSCNIYRVAISCTHERDRFNPVMRQVNTNNKQYVVCLRTNCGYISWDIIAAENLSMGMSIRNIIPRVAKRHYIWFEYDVTHFPGNINVGLVHLRVGSLQLVYTSDTQINHISFGVLRINVPPGVSSTELMVTRCVIKHEVFSFICPVERKWT